MLTPPVTKKGSQMRSGALKAGNDGGVHHTATAAVVTPTDGRGKRKPTRRRSGSRRPDADRVRELLGGISGFGASSLLEAEQ
jgi:hypothetical protein